MRPWSLRPFKIMSVEGRLRKPPGPRGINVWYETTHWTLYQDTSFSVPSVQANRETTHPAPSVQHPHADRCGASVSAALIKTKSSAFLAGQPSRPIRPPLTSHKDPTRPRSEPAQKQTPHKSRVVRGESSAMNLLQRGIRLAAVPAERGLGEISHFAPKKCDSSSIVFNSQLEPWTPSRRQLFKRTKKLPIYCCDVSDMQTHASTKYSIM